MSERGQNLGAQGDQGIEQQVLFGRASYDVQIANINAKLRRGTQTVSSHPLGVDYSPREIPLSERKKDVLTWERDVLTFKKSHLWFNPSDIVYVAQRDYVDNPSPEALERVERLQREQIRRTIRSVRVKGVA